jgi:hypothetical protein
VLKHLLISLVCCLCALAGCSRSEAPEQAADGESSRATAEANDSSLADLNAGVRALARPEATVDYVAAEMEGTIMARTKSQALMHYDGYRVTLTTPGDRVTQIKFDLVEAKPSIKQLTELFGEPEEGRKGMLYEYESVVTGSTIVILAVPVSMPAAEGTLVRQIIVEGARKR